MIATQAIASHRLYRARAGNADDSAATPAATDTDTVST
jgi:hypothetical protein